jgi:hypothetical protein
MPFVGGGTFTTVQFVWKADFRFQSHSMTLVECSAEGDDSPSFENNPCAL